MGLSESLSRLWHWKPYSTQSTKVFHVSSDPVNSGIIPSGLGGARIPAQKTFSIPTTRAPRLGQDILPPPDPLNYWRDNGLDTQTFSVESPNRLLELLSDLSPDLSRTIWDFLRFCNPGFEIKALMMDRDEPDPRAQEVLDEFLSQLKEYHGSLDIIWQRLFIGAFLRGAFFAEIVLDNAGRAPVDILTPDPAIVRFIRVDDVLRKKRWQMGYMDANNTFVPLDRPTVRYLPVDPFPGNPYGRPLASAAVFSTVFLIGMMNDIRRVIAQQGYPRIHVSIDLEQLAATMPVEMAADPEIFQQWVTRIYDDVKRTYASLQPDDAYVTTSMIDIKDPVGTVDATAIGAVDNIIEMLERHAMRALKSMPLLMGIVEGMSEANANRQWEIYVAGIKSLQHLCETMMERLFGLALQSQGIQARVQMRFAELRTAERLRDAMVDQLAVSNAMAKYLAGWISHEEASLEVTGHMPAEDEPLAWPKNFVPAGPGNQIEAAGAGTDGTNTDDADDQGPVGDDRFTALEEVDAFLWPFGKPNYMEELRQQGVSRTPIKIKRGT